MSEITRAYAVYKGQQYNASYDSGTQLWDVDIPSGSESSYGQVNHTYPIQPMIKGGSYTLEFTYEIPPEILKHEVRIYVS